MKNSIKFFASGWLVIISTSVFGQTNNNGYGNGSNPPAMNHPNLIKHDTLQQVPRDSSLNKNGNKGVDLNKPFNNIPPSPPNAIYPNYPATKSNFMFPDSIQKNNAPPDTMHENKNR